MRDRRPEQTQPMDPIPLTLALWLGVIVAVTGVVRLSETAAERGAQAAVPGPVQAIEAAMPPAAILGG